MDETYVGGKETNKHANKKLNQGRGTVGKTPVMSLVQRNGRVRAMVVNNTRINTFQAKKFVVLRSLAELMFD